MIGGVVYFYHLCFTIAGVNNYADITRKDLCGSAKNADDASSIMDVAIALCTIFHMWEWMRWLVFLTSTTVGVNLIKVFYYMSILSIPYGIIVMLIAIGGRFGNDASDCAADKQVERARFLLL